MSKRCRKKLILKNPETEPKQVSFLIDIFVGSEKLHKKRKAAVDKTGK